MSKLNRRNFMVASATAGAATLTGFQSQAQNAAASGRQYLELRKYTFESAEQRAGFDKFMKEAGIPAVKRQGISPIGVFYPREGDEISAYILIPHPSMDSVTTLFQRIWQDEEFHEKGADFINAPADAPSYIRGESSLMIAFAGAPKVETPVKSDSRIFQLRTYESASVRLGQKKIEMFNDAGEIEIFREVGIHPVFFGETIIGAKMPNLTYMAGFESTDAQTAGWNAFRSNPDWQRISRLPEYQGTVSGITNIELVPAEYSEI